MAKSTFNKRGQVDQELLAAEAENQDNFYRRTTLNKTLGMSSRNPYAFQLTDEELETAEQGAFDGNPPVPIWTEPNGLRVLGDPHREATRRHEHSLISDVNAEERRARYAEGKYAEAIRA